MASHPEFSFAERAKQKDASRKRDIERLESGETSAAELRRQNGFFSALDPSQFKIVAHRRRVKLDPE